MSDHTIELTFRERQMIRALLIRHVGDCVRLAVGTHERFASRARELTHTAQIADHTLGKFFEPGKGGGETWTVTLADWGETE